MSLADDLKALRKSVKCPVGSFLDTLDDRDRDALTEALSEPVKAIGNTALARLMTTHTGSRIGEAQVRAHRTGGCRCVAG